MSISGEALEDLLRHFDGVFTTLMGLHHYAHLQKEELQLQCTNMLHQGVIQPSSSAFSTSVLLVKNQDGS
jgi:hypothetical protein